MQVFCENAFYTHDDVTNNRSLHAFYDNACRQLWYRYTKSAKCKFTAKHGSKQLF